ncbi:MAG: alpha/beta fold hydrolase [Cytophagales bacterium]|nr:alpha/beta fold hydrolase [Rhizobacter sp.]
MIAIVARFLSASGQGLHGFATLCVTLCLLSATSGCAWWDNKERELVYRPTPGRPAEFNLRPGDQMYAVSVPGTVAGKPESLHIWWMPHANPAAPTLLYLHGTFRNLYRNYPKIEALREAGFSVLAVDYRGWGESSPIVPSETTILADADVAWTELVRHQPDPRKRVIFGHSMGGGVAIDLASRKRYLADYAALITESTFTNLPDVAASVGALGTIASWITRQKFDSLAKIGQVDAPILMMHGERDQTVPIALGRKLRDAARPGVRWLEVPGGTHSQLHTEAAQLYQQTVKSVINQLPKLPPRQ